MERGAGEGREPARAQRRRPDAPFPGDGAERMDLQHRDADPGRQPAHRTSLAVVDGGQRRLHPVEEPDHRHRPGRDADLAEQMGLTGRGDRQPRPGAETGGKEERRHQRRAMADNGSWGPRGRRVVARVEACQTLTEARCAVKDDTAVMAQDACQLRQGPRADPEGLLLQDMPRCAPGAAASAGKPWAHPRRGAGAHDR